MAAWWQNPEERMVRTIDRRLHPEPKKNSKPRGSVVKNLDRLAAPALEALGFPRSVPAVVQYASDSERRHCSPSRHAAARVYYPPRRQR